MCCWLSIDVLLDRADDLVELRELLGHESATLRVLGLRERERVRRVLSRSNAACTLASFATGG
jgi:hypothetical protein